MGDLSLNDFQVEISAGLGNRREISIGRIVTAINLAQGRIARSYDFSELASVQFAQMNFTGDPALDKYLVPPPRIKTLHSFVVLDTSAGPSSLGQSKKGRGEAVAMVRQAVPRAGVHPGRVAVDLCPVGQHHRHGPIAIPPIHSATPSDEIPA
jgi:hypothetical protein